MSKDGISADPDKVGKVKNWPRPTSPENVRQFVAFAGFYRRFIKDFSKVIKPLSEVMPPQNQKKGRKTTQTDDWKWGDSQEQAFNKLKDLMTSAPILHLQNTVCHLNFTLTQAASAWCGVMSETGGKGKSGQLRK